MQLLFYWKTLTIGSPTMVGSPSPTSRLVELWVQYRINCCCRRMIFCRSPRGCRSIDVGGISKYRFPCPWVIQVVCFTVPVITMLEVVVLPHLLIMCVKRWLSLWRSHDACCLQLYPKPQTVKYGFVPDVVVFNTYMNEAKVEHNE